MKKSIFLLAAVCAAPCFITSTITAQVSAAPAANPSAAPGFAQDAKEKAEDAALLQQLDADQAPARLERHGKNQGTWTTGIVTRDGGIGGAGPTAGVSYRLQNVLGRPSSTPRALVIRSTEPDPKNQAALEEDLAVMSHILTKSLEELPGGPGNPNKIMGIDVVFSPNAAPLRSLYLENYGAVFLLNVNFPLIAPPEKHIDEKPAGDSAWDEARQELYGQRGQGGGEPAEDYNQDKVDKLKDILMETLKNATNIRGLAPEEFVTIWVCGGNSSGHSRTRAIKNNSPGTLGGNIMIADQPSAGRRTVLTLRAKKSEIDSYAKGKLSPEDFRKHVRLIAYAGDSSPTSNEFLDAGSFGSSRAFRK
jgi:hypothetical protein